MKQIRKITLLTFILGSYAVQAQSHTASGGGQYENSETKVTVTIGEPIIGWTASDGSSAEAGFQKTYESELLTIEESISPLQLSVYPNPTVDQVTIKNEKQNSLKVSLMSLDGKTLVSSTISTNTYTLSLKDYATGVYLLKFYNSESNEFKTFKIIKK